MRLRTLLPAALLPALLLTGCSNGADVPEKTGKATTYESVEALRDAFVAAGGECPNWEPIDPGNYKAHAGRCNDSVVIAVYEVPAELDEAVQRSKDLAVGTHMLVGENWLINVADPQNCVDALGGRTVG